MKILLADDHAIIRRLIKKLLLREYPLGQIEEVRNGIELVTRAVSDHWDVIISDISMPVMNGMEALGEIRKYSLTVPVVILSSHYEDQYVQHALKAGASAYVHKYNVHEDLCDAIRKVVLLPSRIAALSDPGSG